MYLLALTTKVKNLELTNQVLISMFGMKTETQVGCTRINNIQLETSRINLALYKTEVKFWFFYAIVGVIKLCGSIVHFRNMFFQNSPRSLFLLELLLWCLFLYHFDIIMFY